MAWWVPYALVAAGTALNYQGERKAEKRRESLADAMAAFRSTKAGEGRASIEKFLSTVTPEARAQEGATERTALARGLTESVDATRGFETPQDFGGKVSTDYARVRAAGKERTDERLRRAISQLSTIGTPTQRQLNEAKRYGTAAGDVDVANSASTNVTGAYDRAIANTRTSSFSNLASQLLIGLGLGGFGAGALSAANRAGLAQMAADAGLTGDAAVAFVRSGGKMGSTAAGGGGVGAGRLGL
jgi:hypothetical protein